MNLEPLIQQASEYLAKSEYTQAINLYETCTQANPPIKSNY